MGRRLTLLALLGACHPSVVMQATDVEVKLEVEPFSLQIGDGHGHTVLSGEALMATNDNPLIQGAILPGWDGYTPQEKPFTTAAQGRITHATKTQTTAEYVLKSAQATTTVTIEVSVSEARAAIDITVGGDGSYFNKTTLRFLSNDNEHFFGLGERFVTVDHRGMNLYSWAEEGGLGGGETRVISPTVPFPNGPSMTYFPVPFFQSTMGYALLANTSLRTEMHLADEDAGHWRVAVSGQSLPLVVYTRQTPLLRLNDYTADTGRPMVPAPWVWGPRMRTGNGVLVGGVPEYQLMRQRLLPVTAIDDSNHMLPDNSYLDQTDDYWKAWTASAHDWGYKVVAYNTPYVASDDPRIATEYAAGKAMGLFQLADDGTPAFADFISGEPHIVATIDLSNPLGTAWYQQLLSRTINLGYDGWMNDFGEYTQRTAHTYDGTLGTAVHNLFPLLSVMAAHNLLEERLPNNYWFFVRSGTIGTQAYASQVWGGDSDASFDDAQGLPSAVRAGINLGISGVANYGSDGTGFKCVTDAPNDKEVFIRWIEFCAVSPIFHEENACANPLQQRTKWSLWNDDDTQNNWRAMASLHTRLAPYLRALAVEANTTGTPIMRHPFLTHPDQSDGWAVDDSYFFGPSLYAAPVVRRGQTVRHVWLPPGRYVDWNDQTVYSGPGFVDVPAPLLTLPLFLAESTLVPMLDASVQTLAPVTEPSVVSEAQVSGVLDVVAAIGASGAHFQLDDGTTIDITNTGGSAQMPIVTSDQIASCSQCALPATPYGGVTRVQFNSASGANVDVTYLAYEAKVSGTAARRYRFDVWKLP